MNIGRTVELLKKSSNKKFIVGIYDDMSDYYINLLKNRLSCEFIKVEEKDMARAEFFSREIDDEDKQRERIKEIIGDVLIIDGTYDSENKTAIDVRSFALKFMPYDDVCFLVGEDIMANMDRSLPKYKAYLNIMNKTIYSNKMESMLDFIKNRAKALGGGV